MTEEISMSIMIGTSVTAVAALVATVLSLLVMASSLMNNGQTTLQSGVDSIGAQEFQPYNNKKVSGTEIKTALQLFQGRDVAILLQTSAFRDATCPTSKQGEGIFMDYGALMSTNASKSQPTKTVDTLCASAKDSIYGTSTGKLYAVSVNGAGDGVTRAEGQPYYMGLLYDDAGIIQSNANTLGTTTLGNPQYILPSGKFQSVLIRDSSQSVIGILFYQLQ
jgi:hypothetical protein